MTSIHDDPSNALLKLDRITLDYGCVRALNEVSISFNRSEVHAIVGEHGAGKSSMGQLISGMLNPKSGRIVFQGKSYSNLNPKLAIKLGISMVHQQVFLNEYLSVAENIFYPGKTFGNLVWYSKKQVVSEAESFIKQNSFNLDPTAPLKNLNLSDQTLVDILKSINKNPKVVILDEAIERLSTKVMRRIIKKLIQMKNDGLSIIFITHRIDDIYDFADRVSVMKGGRVLLTDHVYNIDKIYLIKMAYTQLAIDEHEDDLSHQFHNILKYNEAILKNLPVNLLVTDIENRIKMVNDYCMEYFNLSNTFYFNKPLDSLFSKDNDYFIGLVDNAISCNDVSTFYRVPLNVDDAKKIINLKTLPIFDGKTKIGNVIIIEDITEYDYLQNQFVLSEKLASVGLLAAGVAHEINNPLEIIYNYLSYLKFQISSPKIRETLESIHGEIESITKIVSNLHSFSDNSRITMEEVELNGLIEDMLKLIKHHAIKKNIELNFSPHKHEIEITANRNEIKQVILNLLKNSFEAILDHGQIWLSTDIIEQGETRFAEIIFKDNGPGIQTDNTNDIFLPFYSTKKGSSSNLGLGLSISYSIINKYDGEINARDGSEGGCEFNIKIPCKSL